MSRGHKDTRGRTREDEDDEYRDPNILDIPKFGDEDEFVYRWLRVEVRGEDDRSNIAYRLRQGWKFVSEDELPAEYKAGYTKVPYKTIELLDNCVRNGDLVLGKLPRKKAEAYLDHVEKQTSQMVGIFSPSKRTFRDEETGELFYNESETKIFRGRTPKFSR